MLFHDVTCDRLTRQFGNSGGPLINLVSLLSLVLIFIAHLMDQEVLAFLLL